MQRYKEDRALFQGARHQIPIHRHEGKGMSKGEFTSVAQVNGGLENMVNWEGKDQDTLALIKYIAEEDKLAKVLENPSVIRTPIVRNGKQSTMVINRRYGRAGTEET